MIAASLEESGAIDILDNNVGIAESDGLIKMTEEKWDQSDVSEGQVCVPDGECGDPAHDGVGRGVIVNVASITGIRTPRPALRELLRVGGRVAPPLPDEAIEFAHHRVNAVLPGAMNPPLVGAASKDFCGAVELDVLWGRGVAQVPFGLGGEGWIVAAAVVLLASDDARYVTGAGLMLDAGLSLEPFA